MAKELEEEKKEKGSLGEKVVLLEGEKEREQEEKGLLCISYFISIDSHCYLFFLFSHLRSNPQQSYKKNSRQFKNKKVSLFPTLQKARFFLPHSPFNNPPLS